MSWASAAQSSRPKPPSVDPDLGDGRAKEHGSGRSSSIVITRLPYDPGAWDAVVEQYPDAEVFQGSPWLAFLAASQGAEPVVAVLRDGDEVVGHFVGAIVRRLGVRILGSPLRGWGTPSMGFLLRPGVDRRAAAEALITFAFDDLRCLHVELVDRWLTVEEMVGSDYEVETGQTSIVDLQPSEDLILHQMRRTTRQEIGKALRQGLRPEVATDDGFADEFYAYLHAVFARQGLSPTYGVERVRTLIRELLPSGQLLLLRIRSEDGAAIATGIVLGGRRTAVAWGMAYDRTNDTFHPIELLWWESMRYWRARGAIRYDLGGGGGYKAKYGGMETQTVSFHRSRYAGLGYGRSAMRRLVALRQVITGLGLRPVRPERRDRVRRADRSA
jgi:CelD/BcsL family acetyltransferase involved in cellulose biosynthesis